MGLDTAESEVASEDAGVMDSTRGGLVLGLDLVLFDLQDSFEITMFASLSPSLYSGGHSRRMMRSFSILLIFGCVMSLLSMTPFRTHDCSISPPGTFSTRAYGLMSTIARPASFRAIERKA